MKRHEQHQNPVLFVAIFLVFALGALVLVLAVGGGGMDTGSGGTPGGSMNAGDCPRQDPPEGVELSDIEGKSVDEVETWATDNGYVVRVVKEDGESFAMTMDYRTDRVNTQVEAGVVTRYCGNF